MYIYHVLNLVTLTSNYNPPPPCFIFVLPKNKIQVSRAGQTTSQSAHVNNICKLLFEALKVEALCVSAKFRAWNLFSLFAATFFSICIKNYK